VSRYAVGAEITLEHGKVGRRTIRTRGTVARFAAGALTIARRFKAGGRYDSLGERILSGDYGLIEVVEGGWVLRRAYFRANGDLVGELFNVQTPVHFLPGVVRYTDLEVDVVRLPNGKVRVVDEEDLAVLVRAGGIEPRLADTALDLARRLADILQAGGDWRQADADLRARAQSEPPDARSPATEPD
jgi:probable ribonuclease FAU-1